MSTKIFAFDKRKAESRLRAETKRRKRATIEAENQAVLHELLELIEQELQAEREQRQKQRQPKPSRRRERQVLQPEPTPEAPLTEQEILQKQFQGDWEDRLRVVATFWLRERKQQTNPTLGLIYPSEDELTAFILSLNNRERRFLARIAAKIEVEIAEDADPAPRGAV